MSRRALVLICACVVLTGLVLSLILVNDIEKLRLQSAASGRTTDRQSMDASSPPVGEPPESGKAEARSAFPEIAGPDEERKRFILSEAKNGRFHLTEPVLKRYLSFVSRGRKEDGELPAQMEELLEMTAEESVEVKRAVRDTIAAWRELETRRAGPLTPMPSPPEGRVSRTIEPLTEEETSNLERRFASEIRGILGPERAVIAVKTLTSGTLGQETARFGRYRTVYELSPVSPSGDAAAPETEARWTMTKGQFLTDRSSEEDFQSHVSRGLTDAQFQAEIGHLFRYDEIPETSDQAQ